MTQDIQHEREECADVPSPCHRGTDRRLRTSALLSKDHDVTTEMLETIKVSTLKIQRMLTRAQQPFHPHPSVCFHGLIPIDYVVPDIIVDFQPETWILNAQNQHIYWHMDEVQEDE